MGEVTGISWARHTFNPWIGCTKVSPACDGCYAEALMGEQGRYKRVIWGKPGDGAGTRSRTSPGNWKQPLKWDRQAKAAGARRYVFCASLADVFDNEVPPSWLADLIRLAMATPHLTWLWLTKRPQNAKKRVGQAGFERLPPNVAVGTTVEDPERARTNLKWLCNTGGAVDLKPAFLFVSCEPLLGDIAEELKLYLGAPVHHQTGVGWVSWVITGGETDQGAHKARPTHPDWLRAIRDQCAAAGVPYHHKQNGEWGPLAVFDKPNGLTLSSDVMVWPDGHIGGGVHTERGGYGSIQRHFGKKRTGRLLDGVLHDAMPRTGDA